MHVISAFLERKVTRLTTFASLDEADRRRRARGEVGRNQDGKDDAHRVACHSWCLIMCLIPVAGLIEIVGPAATI